MNTCGTCKYFGEERIIEDYWETGNGDCESRVTRYHACNLLKHLNGDKVPQQIAGVTDGSGYYATLCVTEEFGCNQWVASESTEDSSK